VSKDEFSAKSKEQLEAIAIAFQILTPVEAAAMSQEQLADLLAREQKKSDEEGKTSKAAPKTKAKTASRKTSSKTAAADASEKAEKAEKTEKAEKPAKTAKSSKTTKKAKEAEVKEEAPKEENAPSETPAASSEKTEEKPKKRTTKKTKKEEPAKEEAAVKEEKKAEESAASEASETSDNKEQASEKTDASKDSGKGKNSRNKKNAKKDPKAESDKKDTEVKEEKSEEKTVQNTSDTEGKKDSSEAPAETSEKKDAKEENKNSDRPNPSKNKKQKSRHRSVEIRPAGDTSSSDSSAENGEEKTADGETPAEPPKPQNEPVAFTGVLEIVQEGGYGFVRRENYLPSPQDIFVPNNLIRRFGLRMGDKIEGFAFPKKNQDKNLALSYITTVNDVELDKLGKRPHFERLTPIYPDERFRLETGKQELSTRIIDLVSPIGKGQRGMIVSPPKAGKTILLQKIANAISQNSPKTKLIVLLIDERPEEVTDMQRSIKGEVVYSTFDKKPENHTRVTELVLERAMRLVEMGEDVVILLDSMTRLARAYNLTITPTGRTLSGGLDPGSLYGPKRFFGAARNIENGGSLTIVATSLIETGSRMDEVIFEEFKGTGNMEVYLDRKLSEKRIFPAIDINKSGTRREDLLMSQEELDAVWTIRKAFSQMETAPVTETIINLLLRTNSNDHFIRSVKVSFADKEVFDAMRGTGSQSSTSKD